MKSDLKRRKESQETHSVCHNYGWRSMAHLASFCHSSSVDFRLLFFLTFPHFFKNTWGKRSLIRYIRWVKSSTF